MNICFCKIFIIVLFWEMVVAVTAISQSGYNKIIPIEHSLSLDIDDIIYENNNLVIRGNSYLDSVNIWGLLIAGLDTNGVVLWSNTIFDSSRNSHIISNTPCRFIISSKNEYYIPSKYFNFGQMALFKVDSVGKEIFKIKYDNAERWILPQDIINTFNSTYIFGIVQKENYLVDNFITKIDSNGNMLWIKYYGSTAYNEDFGDVTNNKDGTMTISSCIYTKDYYSENTVQGWKKPWIFTIDTSGAITKEWKGNINDPRTLGGGPFYHTAKGEWIMVSFDLKEIPFSEFTTYVYSSPTITKLDSSFNLMWKVNLTEYTGRFDKIIDLDYDSVRDEFIAAGNLYVWYSPTHPESEVWIVKFKPDGEILWSVTDTVLYNHNELHYTAGLAMAPSGSIYVSGYVDYSKSDGWIIKVTPDGCSDTICTTTSIKEQILKKEKKVLIYPNPVEDELNIFIKDLNGKAEFMVYDVFGILVLKKDLYQENSIIHIELSSGLYFYSISTNWKILSTGKLVVN